MIERQNFYLSLSLVATLNPGFSLVEQGWSPEVDELWARVWAGGRLSEGVKDALKVDADEDGSGGDDAADALRYLVATKTRSVVTRKLRGV